VYYVGDILCEFLGHNFVSGLRTLKPKKKLKNLKNFFKKQFFPDLAGQQGHAPIRHDKDLCC